ncbi:MAG: DegT/DnrJ/EryC1/StrS family aminotransferase [Proteobacteria bacterium]|nr:DegT/DnrJ/EryC1/StrS family aminotransferase [Pseudomonadota bacterium]
MIPLFKPFISKTCISELRKVLYSGYIGEGKKVKEFEKLLSDHLDGYVVLVNSGTSALHLALHITGVNKKEVISTPMTCLATNTPILHNGGKIVWADVDSETGNIVPVSVSKRITRNTVAVMAVHYGGNLCDPTLKEICRVKRLTLIEDCAHLNGPGLGGMQCYSFQAIKYLTTGDGGCLVTKSRKVYERAKLLRWYGIDRDAGQTMRSADPVYEAGYKFHMNDIAATIGISNFYELGNIVLKTNRHAQYYNRVFADLNCVETVPTPHRNDYWLYIILVEKKNMFIEYMKESGIEASPVHYRNDVQPIFKSSKRSLPGLEKFWKRQVCIPVGWWLSDKQVSFIADKVGRYDEICSR